MIDLTTLFNETYVNPVDWDKVAAGDATDKLCANAEQFILNSLLDHHELPHQTMADCSFSLTQLARQVPDDKAMDIWEETKQKFPPAA